MLHFCLGSSSPAMDAADCSRCSLIHRSPCVWSPFALYTFLFLSLHVLLLAYAFIFGFPFAFMPPHTPPPPPPLFLHFKLHSLLLLSRLCLCWLISLLFPYFGPVFHCPVHYFALCTFSCLCSLSSILPLQSPPFPLCICSVREKKHLSVK